MQRCRADLLSLLVLVEVGLRFQTALEYRKELLLVLREESVRVSRVKVEEVCAHLAVLDLVVMNLGNALEDQVDVRQVLHIDYFEEVGEAFIDPVLLSRQYGRLVHLIVVEMRLEADQVDPISTGLDTHRREVVNLACVELAEQRVLHRVEELDAHLFRVLLDLELLQQRVAALSATVLLLVATHHLLDLLVTEVLRIEHAG